MSFLAKVLRIIC